MVNALTVQWVAGDWHDWPVLPLRGWQAGRGATPSRRLLLWGPLRLTWAAASGRRRRPVADAEPGEVAG